MTESHHTASFGFRDVPEDEKENLVHGVFSSVAGRYDLMNDLMSGGIHRLWKRDMIDALNPQPGWTTLDVAGGTGDIAFAITRRARRRGGEASVTVCDINADMLAEGKRRADAKGETAVSWVEGNGEKLPFADDTFDAYTIAFGIRNFTHIDAALREAYRVLKPGGRFLCLEFSKIAVESLAPVYDAFSFEVLPRIGYVVANDADSYRYLVESIRCFPPQEDFAAMIRDAGFARVKYTNKTFGVAALHSAWKI